MNQLLFDYALSRFKSIVLVQIDRMELKTVLLLLIPFVIYVSCLSFL